MAADLRSQYQLAPVSPVVKKIARLVEGKNDAPLDEIAKVINTDPGLMQRLIVMAYPRASARSSATVETALTRVGISNVILLLVGDLLIKTVTDTFGTMIQIPLNCEDPTIIPTMEKAWHISASVQFSGKATGKVVLVFSQGLGNLIACRLLGSENEEMAEEVIADGVGELVNIVTGNLQSRLDDAGLPSKMNVPSVQVLETFPKDTIPGACSELFFFVYDRKALAAIVSINPFSS